MKNTTFFTAVFISVLSINLSFAQADFQLGVKGGLNIANVQTDIDTDGKTGFHAGAFATWKFGRMGIQPELIFSKQGFAFNSQSTNLDIETDFNISYINVPIILKVYFVKGVNLQVGPHIGFAIKSELETTAAGNSITIDIKDDIRDTDLSLAMGAGIDLPFGLNLSARYNLGLSNIAVENSIDGGETRNRVFQVSVGYAFIRK